MPRFCSANLTVSKADTDQELTFIPSPPPTLRFSNVFIHYHPWTNSIKTLCLDRPVPWGPCTAGVQLFGAPGSVWMEISALSLQRAHSSRWFMMLRKLCWKKKKNKWRILLAERKFYVDLCQQRWGLWVQYSSAHETLYQWWKIYCNHLPISISAFFLVT